MRVSRAEGPGKQSFFNRSSRRRAFEASHIQIRPADEVVLALQVQLHKYTRSGHPHDGSFYRRGSSGRPSACRRRRHRSAPPCAPCRKTSVSWVSLVIPSSRLSRRGRTSIQRVPLGYFFWSNGDTEQARRWAVGIHPHRGDPLPEARRCGGRRRGGRHGAEESHGVTG